MRTSAFSRSSLWPGAVGQRGAASRRATSSSPCSGSPSTSKQMSRRSCGETLRTVAVEPAGWKEGGGVGWLASRTCHRTAGTAWWTPAVQSGPSRSSKMRSRGLAWSKRLLCPAGRRNTACTYTRSMCTPRRWLVRRTHKYRLSTTSSPAAAASLSTSASE